MRNPVYPLVHPVPFGEIRPEHFLPAMEAALLDAESRLREITSGSVEPERFMEAFEGIGRGVSDVLSVAAHLESVASDEPVRSAHADIQPLATSFLSGLALDDRLWKAVQAFADSEHAAGLTGYKRRWRDDVVRSFLVNGAGRPQAVKDRIAEIDVRLAELTTRFAQNTLDSTNSFKWSTDRVEDLSGIPADEIVRAAARASEAGTTGYLFGLKLPQYEAVARYAHDRTLRERFCRAYWTRASSGERDNGPVLREILTLRRERAVALGYENFADYVTEKRMVGSGRRARDFVRGLAGTCLPQAESQFRELEEYAGGRLQAWDVAYFFERMRKERVGHDDEALRQYLRLEDCLAGVFEVMRRLHGVTFEPEALPAWHPSVTSYRVSAGGRTIGYAYFDPFVRDSKAGGAWMGSLFNSPPVGYVCTNFSEPAPGGPTLLTHDDVITLFHEFGHLMHHLLSKAEVDSMFGTNVAWDFVELPSQIMENWCWERECLDLFARHQSMGESVPDSVFESLTRARSFMGAYDMLRSLSFSEEDLALHIDWDPSSDSDPVELARQVMRGFAFTDPVDGASHARTFDHVFSDPVGYASGYYSYRWAEVLDADAFTIFKSAGIFDPEAARRLRECILEPGDSEDANVLFERLMGRGPDPSALLARYGVKAPATSVG